LRSWPYSFASYEACADAGSPWRVAIDPRSAVREPASSNAHEGRERVEAEVAAFERTSSADTGEIDDLAQG
jgi:hypothetical protein